jgi:hypothetical protein
VVRCKCVSVQSVCSWCLKDVTAYMMIYPQWHRMEEEALTLFLLALNSSPRCLLYFGPHIVSVSLSKLHHAIFRTNRIQDPPTCTKDLFQDPKGCLQLQIITNPICTIFFLYIHTYIHTYIYISEKSLIYKLGTDRD